jgi:hypothetical protein
VIVFFGQTNRAYKHYMMLQILIFSSSIVVGILAFILANPGFFAFSLLAQSLITGSLKVYIYEFITEIIFPVSPCFGLAIMHALSGLLSLLMQMLADDVIMKDPTDQSFPIIVFIICFVISGLSLFAFNKYPYKLNRSDYDYGRRSTMVTNYSLNGGNKGGNAVFRKGPQVSDEDTMS